MNEIRPARVSLLCVRSDGEALPRMRKRAGMSGRSARTRRMGKSSGLRWISSRITRAAQRGECEFGIGESGEIGR